MQPYNHFTLSEREYLCEKYNCGKSLRDIARQMQRSPSSICRELNRNRNKDGSYHPWRATILYICRRKTVRKPFRLEQDR
jgi:IS30 family transposase